MALKKGAIPLTVLAGVILIIALAGTGCTSTSNQSPTYSPVTAVAKNVTHYMDSLPFPNEVFPGTPVNVVIDVDMDLAAGSSISVKNGNTEFGVGQTIIDPSKVTLRQMFNPSAPDGTYTVAYTTCWADTGKCEDGNFQFSINRTLAASYTDWRGKQDA
ncbi:MAG: hypothetical protein LUQ40_00815, partial [Methanomicrobiales archaeon]|nr:hypothetical protein [Methanomicrobiales archaeon]